MVYLKFEFLMFLSYMHYFALLSHRT